MLHAIEDENEIEKALDYCKKITSFIHCPIQLNDYKRMDAYKENKELLNQVYKTTKELKQPIGNNTITTNNKIFFWYSIALLSITSFNRDEYDSYLEQLIIEAKNNFPKINNLKNQNGTLLWDGENITLIENDFLLQKTIFKTEE